MDKMFVRDLIINCIIGTNPEERVNKQDVVINIALECDLKKAGKSDDLNDTVNYKTMTKNIIALVEGSEFFLLEKMAEEISGVCLEDKLVSAVTVTVDKPGALTGSRSAAVKIKREKV